MKNRREKGGKTMKTILNAASKRSPSLEFKTIFSMFCTYTKSQVFSAYKLGVRKSKIQIVPDFFIEFSLSQTQKIVEISKNRRTFGEEKSWIQEISEMAVFIAIFQADDLFCNH